MEMQPQALALTLLEEALDRILRAEEDLQTFVTITQLDFAERAISADMLT